VTIFFGGPVKFYCWRSCFFPNQDFESEAKLSLCTKLPRIYRSIGDCNTLTVLVLPVHFPAEGLAQPDLDQPQDLALLLNLLTRLNSEAFQDAIKRAAIDAKEPGSPGCIVLGLFYRKSQNRVTELLFPSGFPLTPRFIEGDQAFSFFHSTVLTV
jgi:hypothetical protein